MKGSDTWTGTYNHEHDRAYELFLVHVCEPSRRAGRKYDVTIFLMRHVWNNGGLIGVSTSDWGMFLATCRVTFKQGREPVEKQPVLHIYVDF